MTRSFPLFLALAALAAPAAAGPAPEPAPKAVSKPSAKSLPPAAFTSGPVRADARRLAELIMPEDLYLSFMERAVIAGIEQNKEEFAELDQEHPGLVDALAAKLGKVGRDHAREQLGVTYDRYARAFASHFTAADIGQLSDFYRSRIGQKIIVGKFAGLDLSPLLDKFAQDPDAAITEGDISDLNKDAVGKLFQHLDRSDFAALFTFMRTPAFKSLNAFTPTMLALEAQIASEPDPELDAKLERAVAEVMGRFSVGSETS